MKSVLRPLFSVFCLLALALPARAVFDPYAPVSSTNPMPVTFPNGATLPAGSGATGAFTETNAGIAAASTDGYVAQNTTLSTAIAAVQYSPRLHFLSHAWNSTATAADNFLEAVVELRPVSAATPTSALTYGFRRSTDGSTGSFVDSFSFAPNGTGGGLLVTAIGTNQSITLTPSGTGRVAAVGSALTVYTGLLSGDANNAGLYILANVTSISSSNYTLMSSGSSLEINGQTSASAINFRQADVVKVKVAPTTGNLLLGGLTVDPGIGPLALPVAAAVNSGIAFGTTTSLSQIGAGELAINHVGGSGPRLDLYENGAIKAFFSTAASASTLGNIAGALTLTTNNTTALTLSSAQLATFAASAVVTKTFACTPSALTYASPTSVDVTLASVFTVTTVNATGSVTFNATAGGTAGQEMTILITNDATSAKTITFGTNFLSTGTLTASAVSRHTSITFRSDGTNFFEVGRAVLSN